VNEIYKNTLIPIKKSKGQKRLSKAARKFNKLLSKMRIPIENVNRKLKIFRILKDVYRGKHKNYTRNWNIISMIYNIRYNII